MCRAYFLSLGSGNNTLVKMDAVLSEERGCLAKSKVVWISKQSHSDGSLGVTPGNLIWINSCFSVIVDCSSRSTLSIIFHLLKMNPSDTLRTDSNISHTNTPAKFAPAASDHPIMPSQVEYFDPFCPAQAYSVRENSHFLKGPGHPRMHPPHTMYRDLEYPSPCMYSPSLYPAGPLPPSPDTSGLVPPTVANIQPPSILPIAFAEAVSDKELKQPILTPAKGQKCSSALTTCRMEKPTGDGELPEYVELACQIEDSMMRKSGMIALDDSEWDEGDIRSEIEGKDVLEVSSESDEGVRGANAKHTGLKKTVVKAFRANPLLEPSACRPHTTAASDALLSLTSVFNPAAIKDRDETWLSSLVQFNQINTLQAELHEARQCIESLNDRLTQECRHADCAESQVKMLKYMLSSQNEAHTPAHPPAHPRQALQYHFTSPL
ncbi:uncharacterized protein EDB91DRAFT_1083222 [Suillus paluster]|uniref:uncharacterized protein n=1 Tax=Suillus paluster TaxID=48578 RepID=UPI001B863F1A|nr:uncharacterized protein EDB91DRAFT_1083222 [Suillus paluster]KAG1736865.1 hypothetical protein EDB91DRAFT_1083222 [Suillus paluster]